MASNNSLFYITRNEYIKKGDPDKYIYEVQGRILGEFLKSGKSDGLSHILKLIIQRKSDKVDSEILIGVVQELLLYCKKYRWSAEETAQELVNLLMNSAPQEFVNLLPNSVSQESYPENNEKSDGWRLNLFGGPSKGADRNQALADAKQLKSDAEQMKREAAQIKEAAEQMMEEAQAQVALLKSEAEQIKRAAEDEKERILRDARDNAKAQADKAYAAKKDGFVPRAISELVEQYRRDDAEAYRRSDEQREQLCRDLEKIHADMCDQVKALQANINETLNNTRNELCDDLTHWREDFYKKEVDELAACCVDLRKMLNNLDRQLGEARALSDQPGQTDRLPGSVTAPAKGMSAQQFAEQLDKILKNLNKFDKKLRNAVLGVGLDVYIPVEGDRLDPAQHALENGEEERMAGREIASCRTPGVRRLQPGGSSRSFEPLIRAEVTLKQEGSW